uniref:Importin 4 n=1 Tax=Gallus gallus TaxID=9031 RepID=A0A8V0XMU2_CHICK
MPQYSLLCGVFRFINFRLRRKRPLSKMAAPELQAVLEQLLEPDNAVIQQATARLREAFADPRTPERLAEIVVGAARPQLRQLAAVLLRRRLSGGRWRHLDPELRLRLPSLLAEALEKETDRSVLPSLSHVGAVLLRRGGAEAWAPMGQWVQRAARDPHLQERALQVLSAALEDPPPSLTPHCRPIAELCRGGLQPGTPPHSTAYALKALGGLAAALGGTQTDLLRSLLPDVLRALQALIDADEELGAAALEVLDEFVAADPKAVTFDLRPVLDLCLQVLNALALGVPAEKLLREMVPRLEPLLGSPEPWGRKGALLALGAAADGCGELLRRRYMGAVLGALRRGLRDPEGAVRGAAASALRSVGEYMQPEAAALALEALPAALEALPVSLEPLPGCPEALPGSPEVLPGARSWFVLRELLAVAGAAVAPQLGAVLGALLGVLERGRPHEMELALSALHELGGAVEDFPLCPPGGAVEAALLAVLRLPDPPHRAVRLQAMEVLGALGGGAAALEAVLEMAADGDGEERRVLFGLCGAAAEALREGVEPMLPRLLPLLLHSLQAPPPAASPAASDSFLLFDAAEDEEGAEPMGDEEEELVAVEVGGDFVAEVEAACEGAGLMAEHCGAAFEPYFCPTLEALLPLLEFPHPDVRSAAYGALGGLSCGAGNAVGQQELQGRALTALLGAVRAEKGAGPARAGLTALSRALSPALSPQLLHAIGCLMADVINGQIRCLQDDDGSDEEEVEAAAELRELAGEGLAAVGGASPGGGALSDSFRRALPTLLGCLNGDAAQRSWAAAILGEAGAHLERGVASELLPLIGPALARSSAHDPDPEVRSNALCSIGRLAANGVALGAAWPGLAAIGRALREEGRGRGRDNACGALVRHKGALPDAELLALLLPALPLTEDFEENSAVFGYLLQLQPEQLLPHAEEMPRVCSAIGTGSGDTDLEAAVVGLLQELWRRCPTDVGRGMERLPHSDSVRLRRAMGLDDAAAMTPSTVQ